MIGIEVGCRVGKPCEGMSSSSATASVIVFTVERIYTIKKAINFISIKDIVFQSSLKC